MNNINTDTWQRLILIVAGGLMSCLALSVLGLILLACIRDGDVALQITDTLRNIIGMIVTAGLGVFAIHATGRGPVNSGPGDSSNSSGSAVGSEPAAGA